MTNLQPKQGFVTFQYLKHQVLFAFYRHILYMPMTILYAVLMEESSKETHILNGFTEVFKQNVGADALAADIN